MLRSAAMAKLGSVLALFAALLGIVLAEGFFPAPGSSQRMAFWESQRKGANFFNRIPARERFEAASQLGLEFIRLVPDKWSSAERDFLIGSADHYTGLVEADFEKLKLALDTAAGLDHRVVLGMLSLPGARWQQNNEGKQDYRLWNSEDYQQQACRFWKDLAGRLRGHPAIIAYNPLNEPHPERQAGLDGAEEKGFAAWREKIQGTTADLDLFNRRITAAIREADPTTPVLVEGYGYGSATGLGYVVPLEDPNILYSFHFYEPWNYTTTRVNKGRYSYPDSMPHGWDAPGEPWTSADLQNLLEPVKAWAEKNRIPASRIVAAEFGCGRETAGATQYLGDLVRLLNEANYHWAFYSYREDTWDSMDYELGVEPGNPGGWQQLEKGLYRVKKWHDNPLFDVLKREFQRR